MDDARTKAAKNTYYHHRRGDVRPVHSGARDMEGNRIVKVARLGRGLHMVEWSQRGFRGGLHEQGQPHLLRLP